MDETLLEILGDKLTDKIQKANVLFLTKIGESIKKIRTLTPTQAHQLIQILKYSGDYEELISQISSLTGIDPKTIDDIFREYSKKDLNFAKKFYEYRNLPFTPFDENIPLKMQTEALANLTKNAMANFTRSRALGYTLNDINGVPTFYGLRETYEKVLDEALLNVAQGKETFNDSMTKIMKELGSSGLKTLDYASGKSYRLDSMVRMHLKSGLRELHNENQRLLGEEYGADGVEISVHEHPAEDHEEAQGRQFSFEEFNKLQRIGAAKTYTGKEINMHLDRKTTISQGLSFRPISLYNCYHYTFSIVLGVSKPSDEKELKRIIDENHKGFEFEGKHYTLYEGTQLQRQIERKIREQKDIQILAKASGNDELVSDSQLKITQLTNKYRELCNISGLPPKTERMRVSGYKRVAIKQDKIEKNIIPKLKDNEIFISKEKQKERVNFRKEYLNEKLNEASSNLSKIPVDNARSWDITMRKYLEKDINKYNKELEELNSRVIEDRVIALNNKDDCKNLLNELNINLKDKNLEQIDEKIVIANSKKIYELTEKYPFLNQSLQERHLNINFERLEGGVIGTAERGGQNIEFDIFDYSNKGNVIAYAESQSRTHYNMPCAENEYINYFTTHEMGHIFNYRVIDNVEISQLEDLSAREFTEKTNQYFIDKIFDIASTKTGKTKEQLLEYLSDYGKSKTEETMAELFANANSGKPNILGETFDDYFKELLK